MNKIVSIYWLIDYLTLLSLYIKSRIDKRSIITRHLQSSIVYVLCDVYFMMLMTNTRIIN